MSNGTPDGPGTAFGPYVIYDTDTGRIAGKGYGQIVNTTLSMLNGEGLVHGVADKNTHYVDINDPDVPVIVEKTASEVTVPTLTVPAGLKGFITIEDVPGDLVVDITGPHKAMFTVAGDAKVAFQVPGSYRVSTYGLEYLKSDFTVEVTEPDPVAPTIDLTGVVVVGPADESFKDELIAYAAKRRWEMLEAGSVSFQGTSLQTNNTTQASLSVASLKATEDKRYVINDWKVAPEAYIVLDADGIIAARDRVMQEKERMFTVERQVVVDIRAGKLLTHAQVDVALGAPHVQQLPA